MGTVNGKFNAWDNLAMDFKYAIQGEQKYSFLPYASETGDKVPP